MKVNCLAQGQAANGGTETLALQGGPDPHRSLHHLPPPPGPREIPVTSDQ